MQDTLGFKDSDKPPALTHELLQRILVEHEEFETVRDEEMVKKNQPFFVTSLRYHNDVVILANIDMLESLQF